MVEQVKTKSEPRVRFRGFTDEWEEVKLGELLSYEQPTKYIVDSDNYDDSFITPVLTAGKSFLLGYTDETDGVYDKGDVILFDDFTTATQLVNFEFKVKSSAMKLLTPIAENNINFLYETLNLIRYPHDDHKRYWISEYATLKVKTPSSLDEQQKIGDLFQTLDKTIDLSNTQVENLKQQKKALLQRLFPQKGETEPNVRLRGFTDEWDEVRFDSLYSKASEGGTPSTKKREYYTDGTIPFAKIQDLSKKYILDTESYMTERGLNNSSAWMVPENSILLSNGATIGEIAINKVAITTKQGILGIIPSDMVGLEFMYYLLSTDNFARSINAITTKGTMDCVYLKDIKSINIRIPSLEEQQAIGELFQTLDEQISQAEYKVSQYKELKQALLQRLFV